MCLGNVGLLQEVFSNILGCIISSLRRESRISNIFKTRFAHIILFQEDLC